MSLDIEALADIAYLASSPRATGQQWDSDERTRRKWRPVARAVVLALADDLEAGLLLVDGGDATQRLLALVAEARGTTPVTPDRSVTPSPPRTDGCLGR